MKTPLLLILGGAAAYFFWRWRKKEKAKEEIIKMGGDPAGWEGWGGIPDGTISY